MPGSATGYSYRTRSGASSWPAQFEPLADKWPQPLLRRWVPERYGCAVMCVRIKTQSTLVRVDPAAELTADEAFWAACGASGCEGNHVLAFTQPGRLLVRTRTDPTPHMRTRTESR